MSGILRTNGRLLAVVIAVSLPVVGIAEPQFRLDVAIDPATHELAVEARITVEAGVNERSISFALAKPLEVTSSLPEARILDDAGQRRFEGINGSSGALAERGEVSVYEVTLPAGTSEIALAYSGPVNFQLEVPGEEYARGFQETPGYIGDEGVFLAGSTLWYPWLGDELVEFEIEAAVPEGWHLISQGNGTSLDDSGTAHWDSGGAVDEIYLVGGPLTLYERSAGTAMAQVYLREDDAALAERYLAATSEYIRMYAGLIGPYPYRKFALVENFWETGYGMPSFTLLGSQIIRFPFILTSSYPHEILHNWWGNSVFVDYRTGNWCEGLTAYMADHLMKEIQGQGSAYRRDTLKRYRDFVSDGRDFPIREFRSRHSAATEAVGYGKVLMGFHMLRREFGDDVFRNALTKLYTDWRGSRAGFDQVRAAFEATSGAQLEEFFDQWIEVPGAPDLSLEAVEAKSAGGGYVVSGVLRQNQSGRIWRMPIPVRITTSAGTSTSLVESDSAETPFELEVTDRPLLLEADPEFDLFRLLDPRETAPSIGMIFGEQAVLAVVPADAPADVRDAYTSLVGKWRSEAQSIEVTDDASVRTLPRDQAVWLLGRENKLAAKLFGDGRLNGFTMEEDTWQLGSESVPADDHSVVAIRRHPTAADRAIGWIVADPIEAADAVSRKLPHYGKYSYLGFAGVEAENMAKGEWQATDSPLRVDLRSEDERSMPIQVAATPREPLAEPPPRFSAEALKAHVDYLASEDLKGRGLGTPGLEAAARYVEDALANAGLEGAGDNGTFRQTFAFEKGEDGQPGTAANIIGRISGTDPALAGQYVVVSAHYDHLGHGFPSARAAEAGKVHYGADDNASGVAVLIELARTFAQAGPPARTILFVAFSAEEAGLLGSRYMVSQLSAEERANIFAVANMDTVGRLGEGPLSVLATGTATEWQHVVRGVGFETGIAARSIPGGNESSDQQAFIEVGIPGVQFFTGANEDYHRSSDTADKVDADGLVKVTSFVRETVAYLATRPEPLTVTIDGNQSRPTFSASGSRRVSVGLVPDFAYQGKGVRADGVVEGSPAEAAGMQAGDILTALGGDEMDSLRTFSEKLKKFEPGQKVSATYMRDGDSVEVEIDLTAR